jgi:alpha/beta superfamily hydrolase
MKQLYICLTLISYLSLSPAFAERIVRQLPSGILINAEYHAAEYGKPTVLLIHPLHQTNQFSTILSLTESLRDDGYGVLAPNLSLGISNRRRSVACEAIHMQSLMQSIEEASFWIDWLSHNTKSSIVGIGHSTGALQILGYPDSDKLSSMILISLVAVEPTGAAAINPEQLAQAHQDKANGVPDGLGHFQFSYCINYVTSRDAYLDTASWNADKVVEHLSKLKLKTDIILGDEDHAISQPWLSKVDNSHTQTHHIEGADHFFSGSEEFDLQDKILEILGTK